MEAPVYVESISPNAAQKTIVSCSPFTLELTVKLRNGLGLPQHRLWLRHLTLEHNWCWGDRDPTLFLQNTHQNSTSACSQSLPFSRDLDSLR